MNVRTLQQMHREHPEWRPWLALLGPARAAAEDPAWDRAVDWEPRTPTPGTPALSEAAITVEARRADRWVRTLLGAAEEGPAAALAHAILAIGRFDTVDFLDAAVNGDAARLDAVAATADVPGDTVRAVAGLAAMPVLHACRRRTTVGEWGHGYCPVCGGWPTLAEARGLERARRLRCAPCGGDWRTEWLSCPFCGNDDHARLAGLVADGAGEARKVETCLACRGYVKTITTLAATPPADVAVLDLATVDLDVGALAQEFVRPPGRGAALTAHVTPRGRRGVLAWLG